VNSTELTTVLMLVPLLIVGVSFALFCVDDIYRHDVRLLSKRAWIAIVCLSIPVGGIVYLLIGRDSGLI